MLLLLILRIINIICYYLYRDAALLEATKQAALELNLRVHQCRGVTLYTAGDIEGHVLVGRDIRRYYIIDLARTFPPGK